MIISIQCSDGLSSTGLDYLGKGKEIKKPVRCWDKNKDNTVTIYTPYFNLSPLDVVKSQDIWADSKVEKINKTQEKQMLRVIVCEYHHVQHFYYFDTMTFHQAT